MKKILIASFLVAAILASGVAFAATAPSSWTTATTNKDKTLQKLGFGAKNLFFGWTELFSEPMDYHKGGKNTLEGIGPGLWHAVADTVGGALHVITFPITKFDVPLPEGGVQV